MASPSVPQNVARKKPAVLQAAVVIFLFVFTLILYTFVHESGHALLGLLFGGRLSSFSVNFWDFSAHAGLLGDFTEGQRSLISLAGVSLPLILWMLFLAFTTKKANPVLEWFKLVGSGCILNTLLVWIIVPFLYLAERAPGDDSTSFLRTSGVPPLLVAGVALLIYIYGWVLLINRQEGFRGILARLRLGEEHFLTASSRKTLTAMVLTAAAVMLVGLGITSFYPFADVMAAPDGYTPAFSLNLAGQAFESETVYRFRLEEPAKVNLFFALKDFDAGPARITLRGPGEYNNTFLRASTEFKTGHSTVHPKDIPLEAGEYQVEVSFPQSEKAEVSGYIMIEAAQ